MGRSTRKNPTCPDHIIILNDNAGNGILVAVVRSEISNHFTNETGILLSWEFKDISSALSTPKNVQFPVQKQGKPNAKIPSVSIKKRFKLN